MATTSGLEDADSDDTHMIQIVAYGHTRQLLLYDLPGDDMQQHRGDLWVYDISWFLFPSYCVLSTDISSISIVAIGDDGWKIDSITTVAMMANSLPIFLTMDYNVNKWIDGDGSFFDRFFILRNVYTPVLETGM